MLEMNLQVAASNLLKYFPAVGNMSSVTKVGSEMGSMLRPDITCGSGSVAALEGILAEY